MGSGLFVAVGFMGGLRLKGREGFGNFDIVGGFCGCGDGFY